MRGISAVIELLLVLLILISLSIVFWFFTSGTIGELTESGTERTTRTREILSTCMIVDSVHGNKIYIKNCGDGVVANDSLNVFLDDKPLEFNMTPKSIGKGEIGTITADLLGVSIGDHDLKISNPSLQIVQRVESILHDSAVLALDFEEGEGWIAYDKSKQENNGILSKFGEFYGNTHWTEGRFENGLKFDGNGDYVKINSIPQIGDNPDNGPVTIALWFKTSDITPSERKYLFTDNYIEIGLRLLTSGRLQALTYQPIESLQLITDDWHFAALSYDYGNSLMYFYLDGEFQGSTSASFAGGGSPGFRDEPFAIGADYWGGNPGGFFNGFIDELRIWNKSLSQAEIQAEMQSPTPVSEPEILGFEEFTNMWVEGKFGKALKFGGINNYVNLGDKFDTLTTGTIEWLMKFSDDFNSSVTIDERPWGKQNEYEVRWDADDGKARFDMDYSNALVSIKNNWDSGVWYHCVFVWDATSSEFYVNGILENTGGGVSLSDDTSEFYIGEGGYNRGSENFNGIIDSFRIYNKALTPEEILILKMK